jgi:hypothetical protein
MNYNVSNDFALVSIYYTLKLRKDYSKPCSKLLNLLYISYITNIT